MNRLVIIGNGFDMAHGLKTSYMDFINWYWEKRLNALVTESSAVSSDGLCDLEIKNTTECPNWFNFFYSHSFRNLLTGKWIYPPSEIIGGFIDNKDDFSVKCSIFFESIRHSIETKGWVDIENEYYQLLKRCTKNAECDDSVKELNEQLAYLQKKLVEYLRTIAVPEPIGAISKALTDSILVEDLSTEGKALAKTMGDIEFDTNTFDDNHYMVERFSGLSPERTMLLCFNYTGTAKMYEQYGGLILNYIHGELNDPEHIIFGYGDELDKDYQGILDRNDNLRTTEAAAGYMAWKLFDIVHDDGLSALPGCAADAFTEWNAVAGDASLEGTKVESVGIHNIEAYPKEGHRFTEGCSYIGHHADTVVFTLNEGFDLWH